MYCQQILSISCDRLVAGHNFPREFPVVCKQLWLAILNSSGIGAIDWNERVLQLRAEKADMRITKKSLFRNLGPQRERAEITFTVARNASRTIANILLSKIPSRIVLLILYISCRKLLLPVCPSDLSSWVLSGIVPILSPHMNCQTDLSKLPPRLLVKREEKCFISSPSDIEIPPQIELSIFCDENCRVALY